MINSISDNQQIESFYNLVPLFKYYIEDELVVTISNTEIFLLVQDSENMKMSSKTGDKIPVGCAAYECLRQKKPVSFIIPEHVFGMSAKAMGFPVFENGEIVGTMVIGKSIKKKLEIAHFSKNISDTLSNVNCTINEMVSSMQDLFKTNLDIEAFVEQTNIETKNTDTILEFINNIAKQTNLLGLNAAIESARAGEYGKVFKIVSSEIRKLSQSSTDSLKQISSTIKNIQNSVGEINARFNNSNITLEKQTLGVEKISVCINELNSIADTLKQFSEHM